MSDGPNLKGWQIGFVGVGLMGGPMIKQLRAHGAEVSIWNRNRDKGEALAKGDAGIRVVDSPRGAAEKTHATIIMVSNADAVEYVTFDPGEGTYGIAQGLGQDGLLIDMGTTSALRTREFADRLRQMVGADWVDAPVSGGTVAAEAGTLTIMAGGSDAAVAKAQPLLKAMGERITHVGAIGAGQVAKSANQMIVGLTIAAVAEAFTLAKGNDVEPEKIREALFGGFAHSRILELHGQRMVDKDFAARAKCSIQRKDVFEALELAQAAGVELPSLKTNLGLWDKMIDNGMADLDHSALIKILESDDEKSD